MRDHASMLYVFVRAQKRAHAAGRAVCTLLEPAQWTRHLCQDTDLTAWRPIYASYHIRVFVAITYHILDAWTCGAGLNAMR